MSYQEIYWGLNKKASAEQVKKLAGLVKSARMKKDAGVRDFLSKGLKNTVDFGKKVGYTTGKAFMNHPVLSTAGTLALGSTPFIAYGSGVSSQAGATARAQKTAEKLLAQNKKLKDQSGWAKLWEDFKKWWASLWNNKQDGAKTTTSGVNK